jgi:hypothetical protein
MGSTSYFYSHPPTQQLLHNVPFEELSSEGPQHHHPTSTTTSAAPSYFFYSSPGHSAGWSSEHSVDYTLLSPLKNEHQQEPLPEDLPSSRYKYYFRHIKSHQNTQKPFLSKPHKNHAFCLPENHPIPSQTKLQI